jgi:hypothetical protein
LKDKAAVFWGLKKDEEVVKERGGEVFLKYF